MQYLSCPAISRLSASLFSTKQALQGLSERCSLLARSTLDTNHPTALKQCQCTDSSSSRGRCLPPTTSQVAMMRPLEPNRSLPLQQTAGDPGPLQGADDPLPSIPHAGPLHYDDCRSTAITASAEMPRAMHMRIPLHSLPHHCLHAETHDPSHPPS